MHGYFLSCLLGSAASTLPHGAAAISQLEACSTGIPTGGSCETGVGSRQSSAVMLPVLLLCAPCNLDVEILPINTMLLKDKGAVKPNLVFRFKPLGWLQKMYLIEDQ